MNIEIKKVCYIINSNLNTHNDLLFERKRKIGYTDVFLKS